MSERLFNNQFQPQARPIGSFIQPQQFRRANAAQTPRLPQVAQMVTLQQAGTSSVRGFNQFEQMTESLAPLSKTLNRVVNQGFKFYATSNIEAGYYEELKNQQIRAKMNLQGQQENAAADAAETQGQLEKVDPVAGSLLREANPWKAIGRRRALAQLAAGEIGAAFNAELANNAGVLAGLKPGSQELAQKKLEITQSVLSRFQLTGDEPEAAVYLTPSLNRSWDSFTKTQGELYNAELYDSSVQLTTKSVMSQLLGGLRDGITLPDGTVLRPGDPGYGEAAGIRATIAIDQGLRLLAGKDKRNAMKTINQNLAMLRASGLPGLVDAVNNIRVGSSQMEMSKRPTWLQANPYELTDYTNKALQQKQDTYELEQEGIKQELEQRWNEEVSGLPYDSAERREAINQLEEYARSLGYRDAEGWLRQKNDDDEARAIDTEGGGGGPALTTEERLNFEESLNQLPPSQFATPETTNAAYQFARDMAAREPTQKLKLEAYQKYLKIIQQKQKQFAGLPSGSGFDKAVGDQVRIALEDPKIAALKPAGTTFSPLLGLPTPAQGVPVTADGQKYYAFAANLRQAIVRKAFEKINAWREKNNGGVIPIDVLRGYVGEAAAEIRASDAFKQDSEGLQSSQTPRQGGPDRSGTQGSNTNASEAPVPAAAADAITPEQASQYRTKPIMEGEWIYTELQNYNETRQTSIKLNELAEKAGVAPLRMVIEQLKLYPQLDPDGKIREVLLKELNKNKQSSTPAVSYGEDLARLPNFEQGPAQGANTPIQWYPQTEEGKDDTLKGFYGPDSKASRDPGSWLTAMVMPVSVSNA